MGKDNVAFHTVSFPATILGSGEPWKTVDTLKAFNWLNWYGGKFSTSQKRGVFMDQALELLPADYWRWYLTANAPGELGHRLHLGAVPVDDEQDLADVLGNFVNRIVKFAETKFDGVVPDGRRARPAGGEAVRRRLGAASPSLTEQFEAIEFRKAAQALRAALGAGQRVPAGSRALDGDQDRPRPRGGDRAHRPEPGRPCSPASSAPVIPFAAEKIAAAVGETYPPPGRRRRRGRAGRACRAGRPVRAPEVLFKKIEDAQVAEWTERFGGEPQ